jgi:hypothetical protein
VKDFQPQKYTMLFTAKNEPNFSRPPGYQLLPTYVGTFWTPRDFMGEGINKNLLTLKVMPNP